MFITENQQMFAKFPVEKIANILNINPTELDWTKWEKFAREHLAERDTGVSPRVEWYLKILRLYSLERTYYTLYIQRFNLLVFPGEVVDKPVKIDIVNVNDTPQIEELYIVPNGNGFQLVHNGKVVRDYKSKIDHRVNIADYCRLTPESFDQYDPNKPFAVLEMDEEFLPIKKLYHEYLNSFNKNRQTVTLPEIGRLYYSETTRFDLYKRYIDRLVSHFGAQAQLRNTNNGEAEYKTYQLVAQTPQELEKDMKLMDDKIRKRQEKFVTFEQQCDECGVQSFQELIIKDFRGKGPLEREGFVWIDIGMYGSRSELEARSMGHCGTPGRRYRLLSLRNICQVSGRWGTYSHVTMSVSEDGDIDEAKGKSNQRIADRYMKYVGMLVLDGDYISKFPENGDLKLSDFPDNFRKKLIASNENFMTNGYRIEHKLFVEEGDHERTLANLDSLLNRFIGYGTFKLNPDTIHCDETGDYINLTFNLGHLKDNLYRSTGYDKLRCLIEFYEDPEGAEDDLSYDNDSDKQHVYGALVQFKNSITNYENVFLSKLNKLYPKIAQNIMASKKSQQLDLFDQDVIDSRSEVSLLPIYKQFISDYFNVLKRIKSFLEYNLPLDDDMEVIYDLSLDDLLEYAGEYDKDLEDMDHIYFDDSVFNIADTIYEYYDNKAVTEFLEELKEEPDYDKMIKEFIVFFNKENDLPEETFK